MWMGFFIEEVEVIKVSEKPTYEELEQRVKELEDKTVTLKQVERALKDSEQKYRKLFSTTTDAIMLFDAKTRQFVDVNETALQLYGYTREEFLKLKHYEITMEPEATEYSIKQILAGKITKIPLRYHKKKDGTIFPVEISGSTFVWQDRKKVLCGVIRDITQRKIAEEELKLKNTILSTQQETSLDGILLVDEVGKMISFNNRFIEMWGVPSDIVESRSDEQALKWVLDKLVEPNKFLNRVKHLYANPEQKSREEIALRDGRTFDRYSAPMIGPDGKHYGRVWYFRDITDQKKAIKERKEMALKALEQAELADLGQIATGIAHEINQPLSFIRVCYESALHDFELKKINPQELITDFKEALRQVERISNIISHLRTFGRTDSYSYDKLQLPPILDKTLLLLGDRLRLNNIQLTCDIEEELPCVYGNAIKLEQVFINLTQNSIDALEQSNRGKITVIMRREADKIVIRFSDNGAGIDPEVVGKIFEPFFSTKEVGRGTGLGLSLVNGIIKEHNGAIDCESEPGKGTMIVITLPAAV